MKSSFINETLPPMIVDAHMHIWNRVHGRVRNELQVIALTGGRIRIGTQEMLGMPPTLSDGLALARFAVAEFDAVGVETGVVVQEYLDGEQNEYLLEAMREYPGRFFAHGLPDFFQPDRVAAESCALLEQGFRGLKIPAGHLLGMQRLDDPRLMPIYERMEAEGQVLAIDFSEGEDQVAEFEAIMQSYPRLHVAVGHFGMPTRKGWPGQLMLCRHENVYIEMGGIVWLYRDEGYPFPRGRKAIHEAGEQVGFDKLMWGSDWPRTMTDFTYAQSLDIVRRDPELSEADRTAILGENAARLYRLEAPAGQRTQLAHITET